VATSCGYLGDEVDEIRRGPDGQMVPLECGKGIWELPHMRCDYVAITRLPTHRYHIGGGSESVCGGGGGSDVDDNRQAACCSEGDTAIMTWRV